MQVGKSSANEFEELVITAIEPYVDGETCACMQVTCTVTDTASGMRFSGVHSTTSCPYKNS